MDNTPNYANSPVEQKPSRKKTIWLVLIILALIASNTGWALFYLKQQGEMTAQINTLKAQNLKLTKDNKDLQAEDDSVDTTVYREIPELGVKYELNSTTKDLTYSYDGANKSISWSTIKLSNKSTSSEGCNSYDGSFMGWFTTKLLTSDESKKVGSITIYPAAPDGGDMSAPENCQDKTLLDAARAAEKKAYESLKPITDN